MRKIFFILLIAVMLLPVSVFAGGKKEAAGAEDKYDAWMQKAGLGKYQPAEENWDEIIKAAKEEGSLVVYANTSKIPAVAKSFYEKYGIDVEPHDLGTGDLFDKLSRLQDSGIYDVDVVLVSNIPQLYAEFVDYNKVAKYMPREIEKVMSPMYVDEPLAIQRLGGKCLIYNREAYPVQPVDSWWDLTRPEWKDRIIMKDPMLGGSDINFMAMFIKGSDEMAKAYKAEFGEDIKLSPGVENAGYEFIKRLLDNGLVLMSGGDPVIAAVGTPGQKNPPLGITGPSKLDKDKTMVASIAWGIEPFDFFMSQTAMGIPAYSKNPNAAKLFIKWLYGDEKGGEGYSPFNDKGTWQVRTDIPAPKGQKPLSELKVWSEDGKWLYANVMKLRDFWVKHQ